MENQLLNSNLKGSEASAQERSTKRRLGIDRKCNGETRQNVTGSASTIKIKWKDWVAKSTMSAKAAVVDTAMAANLGLGSCLAMGSTQARSVKRREAIENGMWRLVETQRDLRAP
ncbi:hypothetical protein E3N88_32810 [Mikania micrantha]|uniref:Uncharacterized protein n=1 Tax=Mikania micrantha TaxID=192012 RepID=A0A5N6M9L4_9ASTR|nr:hypothetical protein E3N88_32810 [Mikania micrantha]